MLTAAELDLLRPGDVVAVRTGGWAAGIIRFGASLRGWPNYDNHIVMIDQIQPNGIVVGIEGRPGGVGRVDVAQYVQGPYARYAFSNREQPKLPEQRDTVVKIVRQLVGANYDWDAIAQDALVDLHIPELWLEKWHGTSPGHVVCSSLASWAYRKATLAAPKQLDARHTEPANWTEFMLLKEWDVAP